MGLATVALVLFSCNRPATYFAVVEGPLDMQADDPVLVDGVVTGAIREVVVDSLNDRHLLELTLSGGYSIPSNSGIEIISGSPGRKGKLAISIVASREYYQPGDTIFRGFATRVAGPGPTEAEDPNISADTPVYKIQVFASGSRINTEEGLLERLDDVEEIREDGMYKYYTGSFDKHAEAEAYRKKVVEAGIGDAFIVCFVDGERISVREAMQYEK